MTILVTGGCGFIGSNFIVDWFETVGEPVVNVDCLTYAGNVHNLAAVVGRSDYRFAQVDIQNYEAILDLLKTHSIRAVVNFAAESHVDRSISGPEAFFQTNVIGTLRLIEASRQHWSTLDGPEKEAFRFLHVSTDEVYGSLDPHAAPFTEEHQIQPNSPYSASKAGSDHLVRAYGETYGLPVLTTNCSNNYGPHHFPEKLIPLVINNALQGKPLPVYGDGLQVRDWLYVRDHCTAIRAVLERGRINQVYNVGGGNEKSNIEVVETICNLLDERSPRSDGASYREQITFVKDRPGHDRRYAIDSRKINSELGWQPSETFETGIRKTIDWYLKNQDWVWQVTSGEYRNWIAKHYASA